MERKCARAFDVSSNPVHGDISMANKLIPQREEMAVPRVAPVRAEMVRLRFLSDWHDLASLCFDFVMIPTTNEVGKIET